VPKKYFLQTLEVAGDVGFRIRETPKINMSNSAVLIRAEKPY